MYDCKDRQRFVGVMANFYSRRQRIDSGCISFSNRLFPVHVGWTAWSAAKMHPMCVGCRLGWLSGIWVESRTVSNSTPSPASFFLVVFLPFSIQNLFRKCISFPRFQLSNLCPASNKYSDSSRCPAFTFPPIAPLINISVTWLSSPPLAPLSCFQPLPHLLQTYFETTHSPASICGTRKLRRFLFFVLQDSEGCLGQLIHLPPAALLPGRSKSSWKPSPKNQKKTDQPYHNIFPLTPLKDPTISRKPNYRLEQYRLAGWNSAN